MTFDLGHFFLIGIGYLLVLFGIAFITDRGWLPERIARHPAIYV